MDCFICISFLHKNKGLLKVNFIGNFIVFFSIVIKGFLRFILFLVRQIKSRQFSYALRCIQFVKQLKVFFCVFILPQFVFRNFGGIDGIFFVFYLREAFTFFFIIFYEGVKTCKAEIISVAETFVFC